MNQAARSRDGGSLLLPNHHCCGTVLHFLCINTGKILFRPRIFGKKRKKRNIWWREWDQVCYVSAQMAWIGILLLQNMKQNLDYFWEMYSYNGRICLIHLHQHPMRANTERNHDIKHFPLSKEEQSLESHHRQKKNFTKCFKLAAAVMKGWNEKWRMKPRATENASKDNTSPSLAQSSGKRRNRLNVTKTPTRALTENELWSDVNGSLGAGAQASGRKRQDHISTSHLSSLCNNVSRQKTTANTNIQLPVLQKLIIFQSWKLERVWISKPSGQKKKKKKDSISFQHAQNTYTTIP